MYSLYRPTALLYSSVVRQVTQTNAYSAFEYALKAPETKRQWPRRLEVFLTFLQIEGKDIEERANRLYEFIQDRRYMLVRITRYRFHFFPKTTG